MSVILSEWDPRVLEMLSIDGRADDDWEAPMPVFVTSYI